MQFCDKVLLHPQSGVCAKTDIIECITKLLEINPEGFRKDECIYRIISEVTKYNLIETAQLLLVQGPISDTVRLKKYYLESHIPIDFDAKDGVNFYCIKNRKFFISTEVDYTNNIVKGISGDLNLDNEDSITLKYVHLDPQVDEKSVLFYPLILENKTIGVLKLCDFHRQNQFTIKDLIYINPIAEIIAKLLSLQNYIEENNFQADKLDTLYRKNELQLKKLQIGERLTNQYLTATSHLHELKAILTGMNSDGENLKYKIMQSTVKKDEKDKMIYVLDRYVKHRDTAINKANEIILSRPNDIKLHIKSFDLNQLLISQLDVFKEQANELDIVIKKHLHCKKAKTLADKSSTAYIIRILINNAIYAVVHGRIKPRKIDIYITESNEHIELKVIDNGIGIPYEFWKSIFDAFFTTKPPEEGSGIGLFWARKQAKDQNGTLELIWSKELRGSVFLLKLQKI